MPRGAPPFPLESLPPYFRGARYALVAMKRRHGKGDPALAADADRYIAMVNRYSDAATATLRLKQEGVGSGGGAGQSGPGG